MAMTLSEELELVETAITKVLKGQSVQINGRSYQRPDLETLRKWRTDILNRIASSGTMGRTVAEF